MKQWRISLDSLAEADRPRFLSGILERFQNTLDRQFPSSSGYQSDGYWHSVSPVEPSLRQFASWHYTRGRFWGLHAAVLGEDADLKSLKVSIYGYYPVCERILEAGVERIERLEDLPGHFVWHYLLFPLFILFAVPILLLLVVRAIAKLALRSDVLQAAQRLEGIWQEMQGHSPATISLSRLTPRSMVYFLAFVLGCAVMALCFWLAGLGITGNNLTIALYVVGIFAALLSLVILIAWVMTILGFEAEL